ncbi:hypothetical protein A2627_03970 [Candidatus Woesebacteria bacterium RIFCSPHIGHO2_01_FULL_39_28]|uniref:Dockerin domain-containing protein n=1 Tax=Candidatus Woesebacteria bacterium RIFCSPHIGHO2_01_FULL_39_28 TaxID=1802496 RepID=A0A1F7YH28_9BACT|nr:MAG: hypothetical protein A2627_03970 [Candidatus Woesebacteria bacterium RIFCSPHIGHO2_01_FULL_39_28]
MKFIKKIPKLLFALLILVVLPLFLPRDAFAQSARTATMVLSPGTSSVTPGSSVSINVNVNTGTKQISGIQIFADLTGTLPSNLLFTPTVITGLQTAFNQIDTTTSGRKLKVGLITTSPSTPYTTNGSTVTIGRLAFTAPSSGSMLFTFDLANTFILEYPTNSDIWVQPANNTPYATYTFGTGVTPTPTPTRIPTATPTPTTGMLSCSPAFQTININQATTLFASGGQSPYTWSVSPTGNPSFGTGSSFTTSFSSTGLKIVSVSSSDGQTSGCQISVLSPTPTPTAVPTATPTPQVTGTTTVSVKVSQSPDDAEEAISAKTVSLTSGDLELGSDYDVTGTISTPQIVGIRFAGLNIPQGAIITDAYIEFEADEATSRSTSVDIYAENSDNSLVFTTQSGNLSARPKTLTKVSWSNIPAWDTTGVKKTSPNLVSVIQQVVNRSGWKSGNALTMLITGSGKRTARSYDGLTAGPAGAPRLVVTFTTSTVTPSPTGTSCISNNGDSNGDGRIDLIDFTTWLLHYNPQTIVTGGPAVGDFNCSKNVDLIDFTIWLLHYTP